MSAGRSVGRSVCHYLMAGSYTSILLSEHLLLSRSWIFQKTWGTDYWWFVFSSLVLFEYQAYTNYLFNGPARSAKNRTDTMNRVSVKRSGVNGLRETMRLFTCVQVHCDRPQKDYMTLYLTCLKAHCDRPQSDYVMIYLCKGQLWPASEILCDRATVKRFNVSLREAFVRH